MRTLKEFMIQYCLLNFDIESESDIDKDMLFEAFEEEFDVVYEGKVNTHRWYTTWYTVREIEIDGVKRYFKWHEINVTGDASREDYGFKIPDLNDIPEVFPKEVTSIIYVSKDKL